MDALKKWKRIFKSGNASDLDKIISEKAVFFSPVVYKPQEGKKIVLKYLTSAILIFKNTNFTYINEVHSKNKAYLEFRCMMDNVEVNGIDYIEYKYEKISLFKVFIRPQKALNLIWSKMERQLNS